ncbi:MAG: hypothetical protein IJ228_00670 [Succinivibrio sp.]|nr:hypothetical protein [Succinivibrio sp.]
MKVEFITNAIHGGVLKHAGTVVDLPETEAEQLVKSKLAKAVPVPAKDKADEAAAAETPAAEAPATEVPADKDAKKSKAK